MAGVVRANAGGVSIDTLFIDEGFGSLDGDRLGDVMNMLQGIKNTGRTIGVISHVDEMKTQIAERIVVIAGGKDKPTTMEVTWMQ
jgi:exonuclease SbcC